MGGLIEDLRYFTSVTRNCHLIIKPDADRLPLSLRPPPTERKDVERRICGVTWESNSGPLAQKATHSNQLPVKEDFRTECYVGPQKKPCLRKNDHINEVVSG